MNISDYIGIPFVEKGRTNIGCDCWGLVRLFYLSFKDIKLQSYVGLYSSIEDTKSINDLINTGKSKWIKVEKPILGDVVLLRTGLSVHHLGIMIDSLNMLHTSKGKDSCIEKVYGPLWKRRIEGFYRYA